MDLKEALVESWDRQCRITSATAERVNESNRRAKPSEDGWPLYHHLAHIHLVRRYHLAQLDKERAAALQNPFKNGWDDPIDDLDAIKKMLDASGVAVREALVNALREGVTQVGGYDHPVMFLEHQIFHEGWHVGLIFLALRLAGEEVPEEWEETRIWAEWRTD